MTRWCLIAVALAACAKDKAGAPAPANESSQGSPIPATAPPPVAAADPAAAEAARVKELARNQASLGVSATTDSFEPIEGGGSNKGEGAKPKSTDDVRRKTGPGTTGSASPSGGGGEVPKVGGSDGTRGDKQSVAKAQITAVTVDGKAAPATLVSAIRGNATKVQFCYDQARLKRPDLTGTLVLSFTPLADGTRATVAVTSSTTKEPELESCVIAALAGTKLATPPGKPEATAAVTIVFKAK